jgi:hypothetical protein
MAVGMVYLFTKIGQKEYNAVSARLNTRPDGTGDWPAGQVSHSAGPSDGGGLVVTEVWESREAQGKFMQERLGPALAAEGVTDVPTITWYTVVGTYPAR